MVWYTPSWCVHHYMCELCRRTCSSSASSLEAKTSMGRVFEVYVDSSRLFRCAKCNAHLARNEDIISKNFQGTSGKAYLFDEAVNVCTGPPEERMLMTGLHVVQDLYCNTCWSPVGWKYKEAHNASEKYKEGKFILELAKTDQLP